MSRWWCAMLGGACQPCLRVTHDDKPGTGAIWWIVFTSCSSVSRFQMNIYGWVFLASRHFDWCVCVGWGGCFGWSNCSSLSLSLSLSLNLRWIQEQWKLNDFSAFIQFHSPRPAKKIIWIKFIFAFFLFIPEKMLGTKKKTWFPKLTKDQ